MIKHKRAYLILLLSTCIPVLLITSFAWFTHFSEISEDRLSGQSLSQYFSAGDGSKESPYIISNAEQLYNLTWLQNKDYFTIDHSQNREEAQSNYFKIADGVTEIDMAGKLSGGAIPPIGSSSNPFIGYFDGNGCTIKNLWVSTDPSDWRDSPQNYDESVDYSNGIGFFGYIEGPKDDTTSQIYAGKFFLQNIEVTVSANQEMSVVGLAAGYVELP